MGGEIITSVGIDVGTSTTQLIFSKIIIENRASSYTAPRIAIVGKEVFYRSPIYFTPLLSPTEIDAEGVKKIVTDEYRSANMAPALVNTGAIIITGETARKKNANQLLSALSDMCGEFVVATAGPDLESVLSARGAGTDKISEERRAVVANIDVGGGTSNIAVYEKGNLRGVTCLDIGGRLVKVDNGRISYVYPKIEKLAHDFGLEVSAGASADVATLTKLCKIMAGLLAEGVGLLPASDACKALYTNAGRGLPAGLPKLSGLTFSGGVADFIYNVSQADPFRYGDIGVILGYQIKNHPAFAGINFYTPYETIRATVVGAGTCTTEISGSTISYAAGQLPIKNIPVLRVAEPDEATAAGVEKSLAFQMPIYAPNGHQERIAISLTGEKFRSFDAIQQLADALISGAAPVVEGPYPLIVVVEYDVGKALGHSLNVKLEHKKPVICIDGIHAGNGDYIDIGEPVYGGHVLPVVIKTLIFNS
ncbi:MAG: ethanolamine ammonia-lyase reactivating factor EutA [Cloacibacillus sp.]